MTDARPPKGSSATDHTAEVPLVRRGAAFLPIGKYSECDNCSSSVLDNFAKSFDKSARRWELIVYPSMFGFIILAMYGFFLIYSLTQDIRTMSASIDPNMGRNMGSLSTNIGSLSNNIELMSTHLEYISDNMETMSVDMQNMAESIDSMTESVTAMSGHVSEMNKNMTHVSKVMDDISVKMNTLAPISNNVSSMAQAVSVMANTVSRMGYDFNGAARPMSFINRFMPW
ncbi:MAG: methyl-accepting chemotaxis protein [Magnetococcales bacterium]|nr:methyl-accepting chemotaxis protein [Magnetococcales bacterium]